MSLSVAALAVAALSLTAAPGTSDPSDAPGSSRVIPMPSAPVDVDAPVPDARAPVSGGVVRFMQGSIMAGALLAGGVLVGIAALPFGFAGAFLALPVAILGVVVGGTYLAVWAGDAVGTERAPLLAPMLACSATMALAVAGGALASVGFALFLGGGDPGLLLAGAAVTVTGLLATPVAVPTAYALTAQPKRAGDDGSALPSLFAPAEPNESSDAESSDAE